LISEGRDKRKKETEVTDVQREIGRLEARADSTDERLIRIESKVDQLVEFMTSAKSSWRTLIAIGSLGGALGAAATKVFATMKGGG
jgi:hypothetical protein